MSRPPASGLVHSVQARLKNEARESDRPFAELLELYAVERFVHRLGRSPHREHFVLMASVRAYTPYTTVAEKLEAIVVLGDANSRTKDYYDLLQLPRALAFDGPTLVESIRRTFERRATPIPAEPLEGLADAFASDPLHANRWRAFLGKNRLTVAEADLTGVVASIRRFAQPILDAAWDDRPFRQRWPRGGPWRKEGGASDA